MPAHQVETHFVKTSINRDGLSSKCGRRRYLKGRGLLRCSARQVLPAELYLLSPCRTFDRVRTKMSGMIRISSIAPFTGLYCSHFSGLEWRCASVQAGGLARHRSTDGLTLWTTRLHPRGQPAKRKLRVRDEDVSSALEEDKWAFGFRCSFERVFLLCHHSRRGYFFPDF